MDMSEAKKFVAAPPQFFAGFTAGYLDLVNEILCGEPDDAAGGGAVSDMEVPFRWFQPGLGSHGC